MILFVETTGFCMPHTPPYSYAGRFAEIYDRLYQDKPYTEEAQALERVAARNLGSRRLRILDLACGTGSHTLELARLGHTVTGLDHSPDMLSMARSKFAEAGIDVPLVLGDMADLPDLGAGFDLICCLFDSIGYLRENHRILRALEGVRQRLAPGGLLVVEFWHAPAMLRDFSPLRLRRLQLPEAEVLRLAETTLDIPNQLARVTYTFVELHRNGTWARSSEVQVNRFFQVQEMQALLEWAGFTPLEFTNGLDGGPVDQNTWHVAAVARNPA